MPSPKARPDWVDAFLAALAVSGNVTRSAVAAGVDVTGPYNRRQRYPEFREAWDRVLAEREVRAAGGSLEAAPLDSLGTNGEGGATPLTLPPLCGGSLPLPQRGEGLVAQTSTGAKLGRAGRSRWSRVAEERFLEELTASANVNRAAAAAGFSAAAIYKRRVRDAHFAAGWDAAIAVGRARLEAHLVAAAERTFDTDALPVAEGAPKVSVGEAISILKHGPGAGRFAGKVGEGERDAEWYAGPEEIEQAKERIMYRLERLRERMARERIAEGWTLVDDEHWIPPGYGLVGDGPA